MTDTGVRTIEHGTPPARFARGWHCLGLAGRFRAGGPHAVQAFGTKLVVFADAGGRLHVLDAYCRHMGGDLTRGTVKGDAIACPFHDWRWSGDGRCRLIPYARRVPPAARTRSWLTLERNGHLFVWHDPQGNPPPAEVAIPADRGRGLRGVDRLDLGLGPGRERELPRGDRQRRGHGALLLHPLRLPDVLQERARGPRRDAVPADPVAVRCRRGANYAPGHDTTLRSEASYFGPSYMINKLWHDYHGMTMESILINCHYPVTPTSFLLQWGVMVRRPPGLSDARPTGSPPSSPSSSASASSRTWRSGGTRAGWTTRCCAPRTARSTSCGAGTSSSTATSPTSRRTWSRATSSRSTPPARSRLGGGGGAEPRPRQADAG